MRRIALIALLATVGACAQPFEGRIAGRLADAGLPRPVADCMAGRWVDRLSLAQLDKISRLSEDLKRDRSAGRLTLVRFLERIRAVDDPEIYRVVSGSTLACALKG